MKRKIENGLIIFGVVFTIFTVLSVCAVYCGFFDMNVYMQVIKIMMVVAVVVVCLILAYAIFFQINDLFDTDSKMEVKLIDGTVERGKIITTNHRMIGLERDDGSRTMIILSKIKDIDEEQRKPISTNAHGLT